MGRYEVIIKHRQFDAETSLPLTAATVSPALVHPMPVVITDLGDSLLTYLRI